MKKARSIAILIFLSLGFPTLVCAQPRYQWRGKSSHIFSGGVPFEQLNLSDEQKALASKFKQTFEDRLSALQAKLMSKRIELESLFRDPQVAESVVRAKSREVLDLENQFQALAVDYQIQIRGILTPEQLSNWCTSIEWCLPQRRKN